jgi:hypothetical protein
MASLGGVGGLAPCHIYRSHTLFLLLLMLMLLSFQLS